MTKHKLRKILSDLRALPGETEVVEFKEAKNGFDFDKLGKYFSALSNEANLNEKAQAWLLFGIENKRRHIVGSQYRANDRTQLDSLKSEIANKTTNRTTFIEIHELTQPEGRVVMFQIPAAPAGLPVAWEGHYYGRDGEVLVPLNLEKIDRIRRQGVQWDWSAEPCLRATLEDLDSQKVKKFIRRAQNERSFPLPVDTSVEEFLAHMQLMKNGEISHAAVLAFGKNPQGFFSTAITKCARFHGLDVVKPIPAHHTFYGDVFEQVDAAVDFILSKIDVSVGMRIESAQAPIGYEIPRQIVRETIVNAIAHRDYTSKASVQVMLFADRLTVFNPGDLTPKLNVEQLKTYHSSYPTNPALANLMYLAGYIERFGTGTREIFKLAKEAKLREPSIDARSEFYITIWRPDADRGQAPPKHPSSTPQAPLKHPSSREVRKIVISLRGEMTRSEIQKALELSDRKSFIQNYLQPAINEGLIALTIPDKPNSPKQQYRLTAKGLKLRETLESK